MCQYTLFSFKHLDMTVCSLSSKDFVLFFFLFSPLRSFLGRVHKILSYIETVCCNLVRKAVHVWSGLQKHNTFVFGVTT